MEISDTQNPNRAGRNIAELQVTAATARAGQHVNQFAHAHTVDESDLFQIEQDITAAR